MTDAARVGTSGVRRDQRVGVIGLAVLSAVFLGHVAWLQVFAEDAYIGAQFARNLAEGHGFVYYPGGIRVEGFTNFLFVLIGTAAHLAGLDILQVWLVIGIASGLGVLWLTYAWGRQWCGWPGPAAGWRRCSSGFSCSPGSTPSSVTGEGVERCSAGHRRCCCCLGC
jgi:hypothetical protein